MLWQNMWIVCQQALLIKVLPDFTYVWYVPTWAQSRSRSYNTDTRAVEEQRSLKLKTTNWLTSLWFGWSAQFENAV